MRHRHRQAHPCVPAPTREEVNGGWEDVQTGPLQLIDDALRRYACEPLISSGELVDLLLDLRSAVTLDATLATMFDRLQDGGRFEWPPSSRPY